MMLFCIGLSGCFSPQSNIESDNPVDVFSWESTEVATWFHEDDTIDVIDETFSINDYVIVKEWEKMGYRILTLSDPSIANVSYGFDQAPCDDYGSSTCINIILLWDQIVYSDLGESKWSFYRFTNEGVLFRYIMGEGAACQWFLAEYYTYVHLNDFKTLYSLRSEQHRGISPSPTDTTCEDDWVVWTVEESLAIYSTFDDMRNTTNAWSGYYTSTEQAYLSR